MAIKVSFGEIFAHRMFCAFANSFNRLVGGWPESSAMFDAVLLVKLGMAFPSRRGLGQVFKRWEEGVKWAEFNGRGIEMKAGR